MTKLVRRSHYDLFLRLRSNHLQYQIRPGNFWNDIVSLVHVSTNQINVYHLFCCRNEFFRCYYERFIGYLRKSSRQQQRKLCPSLPRTNIAAVRIWRICDLLACHWLKESFRSCSSNRTTPSSGRRWNVSGAMATRNLTEIYINLRTEISRFKAYSLGDSGVRSDSPGVLYIYATKTYTM